MPALRLRAIARARATRIPVRRTAHQRVRRDALTHTLAGVHLRLRRCRAIQLCDLLLQTLHSHTTTPTFQPTPTDATPRSRRRPSSSPRPPPPPPPTPHASPTSTPPPPTYCMLLLCNTSHIPHSLLPHIAPRARPATRFNHPPEHPPGRLERRSSTSTHLLSTTPACNLPPPTPPSITNSSPMRARPALALSLRHCNKCT